VQQARAARRWVVAALASVLLVPLLPLGLVAPAQAVDLDQVRERVMDLQAQAETATERFNESRNELAGVQSDLTALRAKVAKERKRLNGILNSVDELARATYTSGGVDTSLQVLLAEDPTEFLAQAAALDQVANAQSSALRRTQTARLQLAQAEAALQQKEASARALRNRMKESKQQADDRLADAERVLASLEAKERARLARLEAAERREALAAAAAASKAIKAYRPGASAGGGGFAGGGRAARAVRYALSQVGDRYIAAQAGPNSFDCSGLTMAAWRQAGISLPHYSYAQYSKVRKIPLSQAQPGDLVFYFGGNVHHVGMYIGNGKMVHAANPRKGVIVTPVLGPWYNRYFTGVGRVVG
jgi:cell wall-associated NlpC family hydrolase